MGSTSQQSATPAEPKVLVVDDEELVRTVVVAALKKAGYATVTVSNGRDALQLLETTTDELSCVVLDNRMPGLPGTEVLQTIRERWPRTPVVLCSGHVLEAKTDESKWTRVLQKPYRIAELQAAVADLVKVSQEAE